MDELSTRIKIALFRFTHPVPCARAQAPRAPNRQPVILWYNKPYSKPEHGRTWTNTIPNRTPVNERSHIRHNVQLQLMKCHKRNTKRGSALALPAKYRLFRNFSGFSRRSLCSCKLITVSEGGNGWRRTRSRLTPESVLELYFSLTRMRRTAPTRRNV